MNNQIEPQLLQEMTRQYIKDNLQLDVGSESVYVYDRDGSMLANRSTLRLVLDGEVISEVIV